jgi:butyryl-CoA dehydrogenase
MIDYSLTDQQVDYKNQFAKFCKETIAPRGAEVDRAGEFPTQNYKDLADFGYLGAGYPEEYGGTGLDFLTLTIPQEELSKACASTFLSAGASSGLFGGSILNVGSEEQKKKYLPALAKGEIIGAFGLTEPHCGSDAAALRTSAKKDGDDWILNGSKSLITNAPVCDACVVIARTDSDNRYGGVTMFVVENGTPGFTRGKKLDKLGVRGSPTGELVFEDCRIPDANRIGAVGAAFAEAMGVLERGRIGMACYSLGIAEACLEASIKYASEREAFGKKIQMFQQIHFRIADIKVLTHSARLMIYRAAWMKSENLPCQCEASIAKLFASEAATTSANIAVQIHGGYGYTSDFPVERYLRDAKLGEIGEGTSEIQRNLIYRDTYEKFGR